ncbi:MAG: hypothetical protein OXK80_05815 [Bdellovibrionales bacterium]|nr:hypothetical protein [Bdellovibrionales bacterium]
MRICKNILISTFILYSSVSYSSIYETCDWTNSSLTSQIIEHTNSLEPICENLHSSEICTTPSQEEDAYTLPVFKSINNSIQEIWFNIFHDIEDICFLASSIKGKNNFKVRGSQYSCDDSRTSRNQRFYYCNGLQEVNSCQTVMPAIDDDGNLRHIYPRPPCLSEDYIQTLSTGFNNMGYCFDLSSRELNDLFAIIHHESAFIPNSRSHTGAKCAGQLTTQALVNLNIDILLEKDPAYPIYMQAIEKCPYIQDVLIPTDLLTNDYYKDKSYAFLNRELETMNFTCTLISDMSRCFFYSFVFHKKTIALMEQNISRLSTFVKPEDLESFKSFVSYLTYSGGFSVVRTQLKKFIDQLNCTNKEKCFSDINDLKSRFIDHLENARNKHGSKIYSKETLNYPYAVQRDLDYFQSNFFFQHLSNFSADLVFNEEEVLDFSLEVQETCLFNH